MPYPVPMRLLLSYKDNDDKQLLGMESSQFSISVSIPHDNTEWRATNLVYLSLPHDITNLEESLLTAVLQSIWVLISMEIAD